MIKLCGYLGKKTKWQELMREKQKTQSVKSISKENANVETSVNITAQRNV